MPSLAEMLIQNTSNTINQTKGGAGDLAQNFNAGAQLAQKKEALAQQREQMEQQKGIVEAKKLSMLFQKSGEMQKLPKQIRKSAIKNFLIPMSDQLGYPLGETFIQALSADGVLDPNQAAAVAFRMSKAIETGDFEEMNQAGGIMSGYMSGEQITDFVLDNIKSQNNMKAQQSRLENTQTNQARLGSQFDQTEERRDTQRFTDFTRQMSNEVKTRFAKHKPKVEGTRLANNELKNVLKDFKNGDKPSEISFNAASRGLAKVFNSGAMTDQDVGDFRSLTGIENITQDTIRKWVTGGVNIEVAQQLLDLTERIGKRLDTEAQDIAAALTPMFDSAEFPGQLETIRKKSGLGAHLRPTLGGEFREQGKPQQKRESDDVESPRMIDQQSADKIVELIKSKPDELGEVIARDLKAMFPGATEEKINALIKKARK